MKIVKDVRFKYKLLPDKGNHQGWPVEIMDWINQAEVSMISELDMDMDMDAKKYVFVTRILWLRTAL